MCNIKYLKNVPSDVPDALRIFQEHWGLFAGVYHDKAVWQDYQNYFFNCIQDSDNNLMMILDYLIENDMLDNTVSCLTRITAKSKAATD